jgi:hypothetical protein
MAQRQRRLSGLGLVAVMFMAACGGSTDTASSPTSEPVDTEAEAEVEAEPATIDTAAEELAASGAADQPYTLDLAGGATLIVPAGAPEGITATPVDVVAPDGFSVVASFELAPAGLVFSDPVQLTVPLAEPDSNTVVLYSGVLIGADGVEEFVEGVVDDDGTATVDIEHFSTIAILSATSSQAVPLSVIPVGESTDLLFENIRSLTQMPQGLAPRSLPDQFRGVVQFDVSDGFNFECLAPGSVDGIVVFNGPRGEIFGGRAVVEFVCEIPPERIILVTSDDVVNDENHTNKDLLAAAEWFSAWLVQFSSGFEGMAASVVDVGCDGIGAGDLMVFAPEMVLPDGSAVLGLERFGCNGLLLLPADSTLPTEIFPFTLADTPLQRADGSWTIAGEYDELGASFVINPTDGEIARWEVTGQDGIMPLVL